MKHLSLVALALLLGCSSPKEKVVVAEEVPLALGDLSSLGLEKLSDYGFFREPLRKLMPTDSVVAYALNSPLFTDYAYKKRFIKIPKGQTIDFHATETLNFPAGTILIKNFYYPADFSKPDKDWRILETRLLINENNDWKALTYIWNEEQTDALLDVAGKTVPVSWTHTSGQKRNIQYSIPNLNQCKNCHMRGGNVSPIGPTARQLNRPGESSEFNQLVHWQKLGLLTGLPELAQVEKLVAYEDVSATLDNRARAWLEVNCAHCHRPDGPAKTSGLHLLASVKNPMELGIGKAPVAAGKGSGGLLYDIVPGHPEQSILQFRINSVDPGTMMPELGRSIVHEEGAALIHDWITAMKNR
jgi:uncharacterized repeat protein (TIGR03806 family)